MTTTDTNTEPEAVEPVVDPNAVAITVNGKPAAVVNRLSGKSQLSPSARHCAVVGAMLAKMHLAGRSFDMQQANLRGLAWWTATVPAVLPHLEPRLAELMRDELAYQQKIAAFAAEEAAAKAAQKSATFKGN